jgi:hypothetical protein
VSGSPPPWFLGRVRTDCLPRQPYERTKCLVYGGGIGKNLGDIGRQKDEIRAGRVPSSIFASHTTREINVRDIGWSRRLAAILSHIDAADGDSHAMPVAG